jgi:hypothetical protein
MMAVVFIAAVILYCLQIYKLILDLELTPGSRVIIEQNESEE